MILGDSTDDVVPTTLPQKPVPPADKSESVYSTFFISGYLQASFWSDKQGNHQTSNEKSSVHLQNLS